MSHKKVVKILGLIPARGGSKGVPRKNIRLLCGKPLLQYTAEAALGSKLLSRIILSTEDEEISEMGRKCGLDVPFMRPPELAQDDTPTLPVVKHALKWLEDNSDVYDALCLLQPTNPLRGSEIIDRCIELFSSRQADTVVTVLPVPHEYNPHWVYLENENGQLQLAMGEDQPIPSRQALPSAYHREGSVYLSKVDFIVNRNSLYGDRVFGYQMVPDECVNIDTAADWESAESLIMERKK